VACFSHQKNRRQNTTFTMHFTTFSPSKNHVLHARFRKTPSKNTKIPSQKKSQAKGFGSAFLVV
jgi:hypothetical protein